MTPLGPASVVVDGGDMDCGSGLLLLITRAMRRLEPGGLLAVRSADVSVTTDLPAWADLVGHTVASETAESGSGPWWFAVRKKGAGEATVDSLVPGGSGTVFSLGDRTPLGTRLWASRTSTATWPVCTAARRPSLSGTATSPQIAFRVAATLRERAAAVAAREGKTISQLAREALEERIAHPR